MASGASPEDRDALERLEPKEAVLEFLAAFSRQSRKHSSRVSATTASLQKCKSWATSLGRHRSLQALVQDSGPAAGSRTCASDNPGGSRKANRQSVLQHATHVLDSARPPDGENGLVCTKGHPVTKRKVGLRLHQKWEFWSERRCDFCDEEIAQNAVRWRCNEHCDFDICEPCYESGQRQDDSQLLQKGRADSRSLSLSGPGLGVVQVEIPRDKVQSHDGIVFYEVEVTPAFSESSPPLYSVRKRYNQFLELKTNLGPEAEKLRPAFPGKLSKLFQSESSLEDRRSALSQWLQAAVAHPLSSSAWRDSLRRFLQFDPERDR